MIPPTPSTSLVLDLSRHGLVTTSATALRVVEREEVLIHGQWH